MWGEHSQTYGLPMTTLKTDNVDQIAKYQADMQKFIQNRSIVMGLSGEFQVLTASGSDPHNIYLELIKTCNSEISKAILSVTMTTDDGSSRSQSEVHERVADEVSEQDRAWMTYVINDVVFPKLIALGYKLENTSFKFLTKEKRSYAEKLNTIPQLTVAGYYPDGESIKHYLDLTFDVPASVYPNQQAEPKASLQKKVKS